MNKDYGVIIHPKSFDALLKMEPETCGQIIKNMILTFQGKEEEIKHFTDYGLDYISEDLCSFVKWDKENKDSKSAAGKKSAEKKKSNRTSTDVQQDFNRTSTDVQQDGNIKINIKNNINKDIGFKPNQFTAGVSKTEIDFDELAKKLIKN